MYYRDPRFTSQFWGRFQDILGMKLTFGITFHPQTDKQSEWTINILEAVLVAYMIYFQGDWETQIPLVEFSYNKSYQSCIQKIPYEALLETL